MSNLDFFQIGALKVFAELGQLIEEDDMRRDAPASLLRLSPCAADDKKQENLEPNSWNEYKPEINLECIKDYINNKYKLKCNELKVKFLVSKNIKYEAFQISLYHNETKVLYITSLCRIEICIKSDDKRHDRLYRNEYLQNKECQNTVELLKNEIKEYVNQYNQN